MMQENGQSEQRTAIVTGGTSGVGFHAARALAARGFEVVLASRDIAKGRAAIDEIVCCRPDFPPSHEPLDTADLTSVRSFCERIGRRFSRVDLLINCAGFARVRSNELSIDGFDRQMAGNYLGHFAMVGRLLPLLKESAGARIVGVSSVAHFFGSVDRHRLPFPFRSYCDSKLAILVFAVELQRRFAAHGWTQRSLAAHPGFAQTRLFDGIADGRSFLSLAMRTSVRWLGQPAEHGAWPLIHAAAAPDAEGGAYYGPDGLFALKGAPAMAARARRVDDLLSAQRLWAASEEMTAVEYRF